MPCRWLASHSLPLRPSPLRKESSLFAPTFSLISTLSLHDALPICLTVGCIPSKALIHVVDEYAKALAAATRGTDRKSTRLNSSHVKISYAVFCLKKKRRARKRR